MDRALRGIYSIGRILELWHIGYHEPQHPFSSYASLIEKQHFLEAQRVRDGELLMSEQGSPKGPVSKGVPSKIDKKIVIAPLQFTDDFAVQVENGLHLGCDVRSESLAPEPVRNH